MGSWECLASPETNSQQRPPSPGPGSGSILGHLRAFRWASSAAAGVVLPPCSDQDPRSVSVCRWVDPESCLPSDTSTPETPACSLAAGSSFPSAARPRHASMTPLKLELNSVTYWTASPLRARHRWTTQVESAAGDTGYGCQRTRCENWSGLG